MTNTLRRGLLKVCAMVALSALPASAATIWNFTGTCTDCPDIGEAVLVATPNGNSVSFTLSYSSDWISYTLTSPDVFLNGPPFTGSSFTFGPTDAIYIEQFGATITSFGGLGNPLAPGTYTDRVIFQSNGNGGTWFTGTSAFFLDYGTGTSWTQASSNSGVPEPSTFGLAGLSGGLLLLRQWRRRRV